MSEDLLVKDNIFRNYDIRGIYPGEINDHVAEDLGRGAGALLAGKGLSKVAVGMDDRKSSPALSKAFIKGLVRSGMEVTDIGISLTPIIHYLTCVAGFDAGVIVTASHNPKEYNGFRLDYKGALPLFGDDIQKIKEIIKAGAFVNGRGTLEEKDLNGLYVDYYKKLKVMRKFKVVFDCGGGATSLFVPRIFSETGVEILTYACKINSNFPQGVPDPESPLFMDELSQEVIKARADLGFCFDTDGDRFGVVDDKGRVCTADSILAVFSRYLLKRKPGAVVVCDVKCSQSLVREIEGYGGNVRMIRTGHSYFVQEMVDKGAIIGAEFSGHMYFGDSYFGYDDGLYAAYRLLHLLDQSDKADMPRVRLSDLIDLLPKRVSSPEIKIKCLDSKKFSLVKKITLEVKKSAGIKNLLEIDGVRAQISDTGWFLIRASNTTPCISIRMEGRDKEEAAKIIERVAGLLLPFKELDFSDIANWAS